MENIFSGLAASMEKKINTIMESCIRYSGDKILLTIKAVPGASKSAPGEVKEGRLKVRIAAAPENGKANDELRSLLAKILELPRKDVILESGEKSRLKTISLPAAAKEKLERLIINAESRPE